MNAAERIRARVAELQGIRARYLAYQQDRVAERDHHGAWDVAVNLSETECEIAGLEFAVKALDEDVNRDPDVALALRSRIWFVHAGDERAVPAAPYGGDGIGVRLDHLHAVFGIEDIIQLLSASDSGYVLHGARKKCK